MIQYIGKPQECMNFLYCQDKEKLFEVKEYKMHRSNEANRYLWKLCGLIADEMRILKEDCYVQMLKHYGQSEVVSVLSHINIAGYFKYFEEIGTGKVQGKDFTHYRIYKGSSEYDTREMSILLDGVVQEAKSLEICTLSADEIERLKAAWKP